MVLGIGVDIIEISRIDKALQSPRFTKRVFSAYEQEYCLAKGRQAAASFAARFAAKEAMGKALGTGVRINNLTCIEIQSDSNGRPYIVLSGSYLERGNQLGVKHIFLSLTHSKEYAVAQVVITGG